MNRAILLFSLLVSGLPLAGQKPVFINSSAGASIYQIVFDGENGKYISGSVNGNVNVNGQVNNMKSFIVGKVDNGGNFRWIKEYEFLPRTVAVVNGSLYVLSQQRQKGNPEIISLIETEYDFNGTQKSRKSVQSITGTQYEIFLDGKYHEDGLITWATMKGTGSVANMDGIDLAKSNYGILVLTSIDLNGKRNWQYTIDGGVDNFTEPELHAIKTDDKGNTFITGFYGAIANFGITTKTTPVMYKSKTLPLYYHKLFLVKVDKEGKVARCEDIADNSVNIEDMMIEPDGSMYFSGYHKGNDMYARKQQDGRPYIGAKLFGKPFTYEESESIEAPDEDGFLVKVDADWNLLWAVNFKGKSTVRASKIAYLPDGVAVSGIFFNELRLNGTTYSAHPENGGYSDSFYCTLNKLGSVTKVVTFTAPKSNFANVFNDAEKAVILVGTASEQGINIDNQYFPPGSTSGGAFLWKP